LASGNQIAMASASGFHQSSIFLSRAAAPFLQPFDRVCEGLMFLLGGRQAPGPSVLHRPATPSTPHARIGHDADVKQLSEARPARRDQRDGLPSRLFSACARSLSTANALTIDLGVSAGHDSDRFSFRRQDGVSGMTLVKLQRLLGRAPASVPIGARTDLLHFASAARRGRRLLDPFRIRVSAAAPS
jgi:hypothetical protein